MSLDLLSHPPAFEPSEHDSELPTYAQIQPSPRRQSASTGPVTHSYHLSDKAGNAWLVMKCTSRSSKPEYIPRIHAGDKIEGSVELNLTNWKPIKSVRVAVIGELITSSDNRYPFLGLSQELWLPAISLSGQTSESAQIEKGKLRGSWAWSFVFELPEAVDMKEDGNMRKYQLPASFLSRQVNCTILYRLVTTVVSGKFIPNYTCETTIKYLPMIKPDLASPVRQLAYQQNCPLVGPDGDPEGWHTLPPVVVPGTLFGERTTEVEYTLSLAKPLSYTRGSVIPLFLTLSGTDSQALDILSSCDAPIVRLRRCLVLGHNSAAKPSIIGNKAMIRASTSRPMYAADGTTMSHLQFATWWRSPYDTESGSADRVLQGEIHLPGALIPPASLAKYKLSYDVAMYNPNAAGFIPSSTKQVPLQSVAVEVATIYADGPRPVKYAPPKYDNLAEAVEEVQMLDRSGFL